jgi:uncharacterized delta-60 repeat protein
VAAVPGLRRRRLWLDGCGDTYHGEDFALVRYTPAGKLDTSFGSRIVVGGYGDAVYSSDVGLTDDFARMRYTPGGKHDANFGPSGKVLTHPGAIDDSAHGLDVAVQRDEKIVAAGETGPGGGQSSDFALVRYMSGGKLDADAVPSAAASSSAFCRRRPCISPPLPRLRIGSGRRRCRES